MSNTTTTPTIIRPESMDVDAPDTNLDLTRRTANALIETMRSARRVYIEDEYSMDQQIDLYADAAQYARDLADELDRLATEMMTMFPR